MRQMALVSVALWIGCGGGGLDKERKVCTHVDKICGGDPEPVDQCAKDLRELKEPAGDTYDRFLDCSLGAKTCPEFAGCFVGGLAEVAEQWKHQFEDGVDRMRRKSGSGRDEAPRVEDDKWSTDDSTLPAECKPILATCNKDESIVRMKCREMIGNLGRDPEHRSKLARCIDGAKNCFAISTCLDDLWFELR